MNINDLIKGLPVNFSQTLRDIADALDELSQTIPVATPSDKFDAMLLNHFKPATKSAGQLLSLSECRMELVRRGESEYSMQKIGQSLRKMGFIETVRPEYSKLDGKTKRGFWVELQ